MHPSDATLLALIHGELARGPAAQTRSHLASCPPCEARAAELRARDSEIGLLLGTLDHPVPRLTPPAGRARGPGLRHAALAASLALLIAGVAAAAVPGTLLNRWIRTRLAAAPAVAPAPAAPRVPTGAQSAGGVDVPATRGLAVVFDAPEAGGVLTVTVADRPDVSLRAFGGAVAYQVGDGRIAVDNRRPALRYALEVPPGLRRLTVSLGSRLVFDSDTRPLPATGSDTISLSPESSR